MGDRTLKLKNTYGTGYHQATGSGGSSIVSIKRYSFDNFYVTCVTKN